MPPSDPDYTHVSLSESISRIHKVSKNAKPSDVPGVLNYIQFIAIEALTEAGAPITPYGHVGSPPPPCPGCPPGKP